MKIIERIKELLKANDRLVRYDYFFTHFNVNIFSDGSINCDESLFSKFFCTYRLYFTKPIITISLRYSRSNETNKEDFEESDYNELIKIGIEKSYQHNLTNIDIKDFIEQETKEA